jgi:ankyrin repeat protein
MATDTAHIDPIEQLAAAVHENDSAQVQQVLARHPELRSRLNDPLPGGAFGATALLAAVHHRNREMIEVLLRAGADINARSHWWAGSFGVLDADTELAPFLIDRGATVDVHAAARLGMTARVEELISADPSRVHARGGDGQTPLHVASSIEIARYLLDRGADIDARDIDHESTPAQYMVRDRQEIARYLVERGARTDILMSAALGDLARVRNHLADPDAIRTSVSDACFPKRDLRSGGTIYIWTLGAHKTPHIVAHEFGHGEVLRTLMDQTPDGLKLAIACELGDEATVRTLVGRESDLARSLDDHALRRLAVAAQNNDAAAVRRMLDAGWRPDVRGQHGATPLHWAAWHGNVEMGRDLVRRKAPLDVIDEDFGGTPAGWAVYASVQGSHPKSGDYAGTLEALLDAGATPPKVTPDTAMSDAVRDVLRRRRVI